MGIHQIDESNIYLAADLYYKVFSSPQWGFDWLDKEKVYRYFTDLLNTPRFVGYIYNSQEEPVGACLGTVSDYFNTVQYYIKELFIVPQLQNKGIGSIFLSEAEKELAELGVDNMTLFSAKSIPAYSFYHKNGYVDSKDSVFMIKFMK